MPLNRETNLTLQFFLWLETSDVSLINDDCYLVNLKDFFSFSILLRLCGPQAEKVGDPLFKPILAFFFLHTDYVLSF